MNSAPAPKPAGRSLLWTLMTFALLVLCSLAAVVIFLTGGNLEEFRAGPSWTPIAPAEAIAQTNNRPEDQSFVNGAAIVVAYAGGVNLRRTPGFQNKLPGDTLRTVPEGAAGTITGGPVEQDGLRWWQVRFDGEEGWMAERSSQGRVLLVLQGA
ncbi:MAG: hypothetical protein KDI55_16070 [Anaerolineae bacterium]|nr:hypothetical protein [Anaerolineae bacterium]